MVLIMNTSQFKFGMYLSHSISPPENWVGNPASFIFSITLSLKIPYHGKIPPSGRERGSLPSVLYCGHDHLSVGNGDLYIAEDLALCSSELEGCFGVGISRGNEINMNLLAGMANFRLSHFELWLIT